MDSPRHLSFLATKSLSSLREEAERTDGVAALKKQRRYQRIDFDGMAATRIPESTTRESIHSRWSSNASTVREQFLEDRASRRASDYHAKATSPTISPTIADSHLQKVDVQGSQVHTPKPKRSSSRPTDMVAPDSPPELPLIRISSFPDLVAAGLAMSSNRTPDTTPVSISDSFTVSDSSSFHGLLGFASEFPQPPSLSPALRKMQSVPWLKDDNANAVSSGHYSSWRRMGGLVTPQEPERDVDLSFPYSMDDIPSIPSANSSFYLDTLMALNQQQKALGGEVPLEEGLTKAGDVSWSEQDAYKTRTTDDLFEWSISHQREDTQRAQPSGDKPFDLSAAQTRQRLIKRTDGRRNTVSSTLDAGVPLVADKRRTVRKVSSMQASSEQRGKPFSEATTTTTSKTATVQRSIPKIRSRLFASHSYNSNPSSASGKQDNEPLALGSRSQTELGSKSRNWFFHLRNSSGKAANVKQDVSSSAVATPTGARPISATAAAASPSFKDDSERRNFRNTLRQQHQRTPYPSQGCPPPTLASANDKRTSKIYRRSRYRDSEPHISGLGLTDIDSEFVAAAASQSSVGLCLDIYGSQGTGGSGSGQNRPLDGPFTLKKSQANEYARASSNRRSLERQDTSVETSTSFMDITPERKKVTSTELKPGDEAAAVERKDRVRKFIAKASNGFLEWSRGLTSAKRS
ncbi:hypothetical protein EST38_g253 [Candolleomyces aberdarensis]|uniref:Uncharacterized protein n=1 Tax=Candolleomyces aberdarensis TaxID=2316362 RepID=A0A4Q2E2C4_9AGAR|nr:hypothetical protein EST38_g253 [Candolleomyces aberdarensis]